MTCSRFSLGSTNIATFAVQNKCNNEKTIFISTASISGTEADVC